MSNNFDNSQNVAKINSLIAQTSDAILCNPECQQKRQADTLKRNWEDALVNVKAAPQQADDAEKKYYTFIGDEYKYNSKNDKKINDDAMAQIQKYTDRIKNKILNIETLNQDNNTIIQNIDHINLLIHNFEKNNNDFNGIHESKNDIETNDRKTYYNTITNNSVKSYTLYYIIIYYILLIIYFIYLYGSTEIISSNKIYIVLFFILYPLIINWLGFIWTYIYDFIISRFLGLNTLPSN